MTFNEIRDDIRIQHKLLKHLLKKMEKQQTLVKKVEEYNEIGEEIRKIYHAVNLMEAVIWILKDKQSKLEDR